MADLAVVSDVADRWRPLSTAETAVATVLLGDASALVRAAYPGVDADITSGALDSTVVAGVVAQMVKRAMLRADGVKSEATGPYSVTYDNAAGNLFLTAAERLLLGDAQTATAKSVRFG